MNIIETADIADIADIPDSADSTDIVDIVDFIDIIDKMIALSSNMTLAICHQDNPTPRQLATQTICYWLQSVPRTIFIQIQWMCLDSQYEIPWMSLEILFGDSRDIPRL